jgi:hypothetical protein
MLRARTVCVAHVPRELEKDITSVLRLPTILCELHKGRAKNGKKRFRR